MNNNVSIVLTIKQLKNVLTSILISVLFFVPITFCENVIVPVVEKPETKLQKHCVRVLLQEVESPKDVSWKVSSSGGFIIVDPEAKTKTRISDEQLIITRKKNFFSLNNLPYEKKRFYLLPISGNLKLEQKEYQGSFLITFIDQNSFLINSLDIEDYVFSVLKTESWPGWPLEVNKAFAIASRSYVIGVILANHSSSTLPYHVKNTNKHQTYSGHHVNEVLKAAVEQTRGVFLTYKNKPIIAMFDSCCGGVIPAHIHGMNFLHAPYLARTYACGFCKGSRNYSWKVHYPIEQFEQMLTKEYKNLKKIKEIKIVKMDKAGLAQQIHVKTPHKQFSFSGKKMYSMLAKVKSFCYEITSNNKEIIFTGKGLGHHMGLCQWGAREMINQGYDYKAILDFYYPNTNFMRLQT